MILGAYCRTQQRFRRIILCNSGSCFNRSPPRFFYSSSLHLPSSSYHHFSMNPCTKRLPPLPLLPFDMSSNSMPLVRLVGCVGLLDVYGISRGDVCLEWVYLCCQGLASRKAARARCALEGHVSEGKSPTPVLLGLLMLLLPVASLLLSLEWGRSAN